MMQERFACRVAGIVGRFMDDPVEHTLHFLFPIFLLLEVFFQIPISIAVVVGLLCE